MPKDEPSQKPLLEKLGVKPGMAMAALNFDDLGWTEGQPFDTFLLPGKPYDLVVFRAGQESDLEGLHAVKKVVAMGGMFWVAFPRGGKTITEYQVMAVGGMDSWTDVKVCRFSEIDTSLKFLRRRVK